MRIAALAFGALSVATAQTQLDGNWWKNSKPAARHGVLDGIVDCMRYDRKEPVANLPIPTLSDKITAFYRTKQVSTPLIQVLHSFPRNQAQAEGQGEDYSSEKHGYFDGLYWKSAASDQQSGFVLGYVSCRTDRLPTATEVSRLVRGIEDFYDNDPSPSAEDKKIADLVSDALRLSPRPANPRRQ
jgi:hypothetical protein